MGDVAGEVSPHRGHVTLLILNHETMSINFHHYCGKRTSEEVTEYMIKDFTVTIFTGLKETLCRRFDDVRWISETNLSVIEKH